MNFSALICAALGGLHNGRQKRAKPRKESGVRAILQSIMSLRIKGMDCRHSQSKKAALLSCLLGDGMLYGLSIS